MRRILFMVLTIMCGGAYVFANAEHDISSNLTQELVKNTADLNDAVARKTQAEAELERRQKSGASVEQLSQVQLSLQALTKLVDDAQKRVETINNKMHVLQVKP